MKKSILFIIACFIAFTGANAQTVFAPPNSKWHYEYLTESNSYFKKFETLKDTMYYGHLCSKIVGRTIKVSSSGSIIDTTQEKPLFTYVNSDTVFYFNDNFSRFYPLYLFNVKAGDTVTYHVPYLVAGYSDTTFSVKIDSVKSILIDGQNTRIIYSSNPFSVGLFELPLLIEKIGGIYWHSIIGYTSKIITASSGGGIRCYSDALIDSNFNKEMIACEDLKTTRINLKNRDVEIKISPNPVQDFLTIEFLEFVNDRLKIEIIDFTGRKIENNKAQLQSKIIIDVSNLQQGVYLIKATLVDDSYSRIFKFIKN